MNKKFFATLKWAIALLILMAAFYYFKGFDNWCKEALKWVIPSVVGYFFGYSEAQKHRKW